MTANPHTVDPTTSVADVARTMVKGRFGSVLILAGGGLSGIFPERDGLGAAADGGDLSAAKVSNWMTRNPMTAEPTMDVDRAAELMMANGFRHLPVCEGNDLLGIV